MTLYEILSTSADTVSPDLFSATAIATVEDSLTEKNGRPYLNCRVRSKDVLAKREEIIRQLWLYRLETCKLPCQ